MQPARFSASFRSGDVIAVAAVTHLKFVSWVSQNAVASLGARPEEEGAAQAWDLNANAVDAQTEQAASQEFGTEATEAAWTRYVHREHLLALRNQLAAGELVGHYAGAHPKP